MTTRLEAEIEKRLVEKHLIHPISAVYPIAKEVATDAFALAVEWLREGTFGVEMAGLDMDLDSYIAGAHAALKGLPDQLEAKAKETV